jgi:hypothetical protein
LSYTSRKRLGTDATNIDATSGRNWPLLRSGGVESQHLNAQKRNESEKKVERRSAALRPTPNADQIVLDALLKVVGCFGR